MRVIRKSLPHQKNPKFCGISIKRDTLYYQYKGFGAVPKFRSTRRTCILNSSQWLVTGLFNQLTTTIQSLQVLSSHIEIGYIMTKLVGDGHLIASKSFRAQRLTPFRWAHLLHTVTILSLIISNNIRNL